MKKLSKPTPEAHLNGNDKAVVAAMDSPPTDKSAMRPKNKTVTIQQKAAVPAKTAKRAQRPPRAASGLDTSKITCRYCGSDDLAPSFIKRRDARCRACFKQRYGSAAHDKSATPSRKVAAVK